MTDLLNPYASRGKRTVEITASFPGSALPSDEFNNPKSMTLTQRMKSHDVLVLRYQVEMPDATRLLRTGSPVTVTWGTTNVNESRTWVGYVHTTTPRKTGNTSGTTEIVCVSPSMILKQAAQDTWINRPVMVVAADIIQGAGLDAKVDTHPLTDNVIQAGRTYWQVLREIAGLTGYALTTDNTEVVMLPHKAFFDLYAARARVFSPGASIEMAAPNSDRTLYSFIPDWSDMSEDEYALHASMTSWAIDPRSGTMQEYTTTVPSQQIATGRENPVVQRFNTTRSTYNLTDARQLSGDLLADRRWINQASLTGLGSPDIAPYIPVYVDGLSEASNGWWQVLEVEHAVDGRTEYSVSMRVGRDGSNLPYQKPSTLPLVPDAELSQRALSPTVKRVPDFVTTSYSAKGLTGFGDVGGRWVSRRT
jgi:hypothetical protein